MDLDKFGLKLIVLNELDIIKAYINRINEGGYRLISLDIETSSLSAVGEQLLSIGLYIGNKKPVVIDTKEMTDSQIIEVLNTISSVKAKVVLHNSAFDISWLGIRYGVTLKWDIDTYLIAHALWTSRQYYEESLGLKALTEWLLPEYGGYEDELELHKKDYCKRNKIKMSEFSYAMIDNNILFPYNALDVVVTYELYLIMASEIHRYVEEGWKELTKILRLKHDVNKIYIDAKIRGIDIDREYLKQLRIEWTTRANELEIELNSMPEVEKAEKLIFNKTILKEQGKLKNPMSEAKLSKIKEESKFNWNSSAHKKVLFFEVMDLKVVEKTKTKEPSTGAEAIEKWTSMYTDMTLFKTLEEYTSLMKGITAFCDNILAITTDEYPRVHANVNIAGTVSHRSSGNTPNLQQVPSFGELKKVKKIFKCGEGYNLIYWDYNSQELRLTASIANSKTWREAISNDWDLHSINALNAYRDKMDVPIDLDFKGQLNYVKENFGKTYRQNAKILGFSLLYGGTSKAISKTLKCSEEDAQFNIDAFLNANPEIKAFMGNTKFRASELGYVQNLYGARVYLRNIKGHFNSEKPRFNYKAEAEGRFVVNFSIQSMGAFLLYEGLVKFYKEVDKRGWTGKVQLMTTVYDSMMTRVCESLDPQEVANLMKECFNTELNGVPIDIECAMSDDGTWYNAENIGL